MNRLRWLISGTVCAAVLGASGCAKTKPGTGTTGGAKGAATIADKPAAPTKKDKVIVTPLPALGGKVASVNTSQHFVVITFPVGTLPAADQTLGVYRDGLKVGQIRVDRLQNGRNVVADIVAGEAKENDTVRPE